MRIEDGSFLVRQARKTIESWVTKGEKHVPEKWPDSFREKRGIFTTLNTYPGKELRGCIGIPEPVMALSEALVESAVSVTRDPRFPELSVDELDKITVEVSVLTKPELIKVKSPVEYPKSLNIGEHGLIIEKEGRSGLLLPQVPLEQNWDPEAFLSNLCMKAGLSPDSWVSDDVRIFRFRSEIFGETKPRGPVKKT